ncbi:hypothetical protein IDJ77_14225 [Mucilaginibacter sp. ZT4R22]|uniref:Uncharacterized protein n=1 Tax=Mucilaginibacter pankratovii TaxID=2772110 RepID=A0ABR7WRN8_9SPHI|nr:hypothetical protein [Mucilaginibacter pankratovii]MBD1364974.1 hypothetical protein [Mucilaginibacter pankratovii]
MRYLYALSLLFLFISSTSFAQSYKDAYAITQKGDTLRGYIDHSGLDRNPSVVKFKQTGVGEVQKLPISQVRSFAFTGLEQYERHVVSISLDETNEHRLNSGRDTTFKIDTVFLEVLQTGKNATLYVYTDDIKSRFYTSDAIDKTPAELIFKLYYPAVSGSYNRETKSETSYKKQLSALALKNNMLSDDMKKMINKAEYTQTAMQEIVGKINGTPKSEITKKTNKPIGTIGLVVIGVFVVLAILNAAF